MVLKKEEIKETFKQIHLTDTNLKHDESIKLIAIILMVISNIGFVFFHEYTIWSKIAGVVYAILACRIAQGFTQTSNYRKYLFRLWLFAIIAQIPYTMLFDTLQLNGLFSLFISLFLIEKFSKKEYYWVFTIMVIPLFAHMSYPEYGMLIPGILYMTRNKKWLAFIAVSILTFLYALFIHSSGMCYSIIGYAIALFLPTNLFKVRINKSFFYWFYPIHLAILFIIKQIIQ